jgi:hypothetical protein
MTEVCRVPFQDNGPAMYQFKINSSGKVCSTTPLEGIVLSPGTKVMSGSKSRAF